MPAREVTDLSVQIKRQFGPCSTVLIWLVMHLWVHALVFFAFSVGAGLYFSGDTLASVTAIFIPIPVPVLLLVTALAANGVAVGLTCTGADFLPTRCKPLIWQRVTWHALLVTVALLCVYAASRTADVVGGLAVTRTTLFFAGIGTLTAILCGAQYAWLSIATYGSLSVLFGQGVGADEVIIHSWALPVVATDWRMGFYPAVLIFAFSIIAHAKFGVRLDSGAVRAGGRAR